MMEQVLTCMKEFQITDNRILIDFSDELLKLWNIIWIEHPLPTIDTNSKETRMVWYAITQTVTLIREYYDNETIELGLSIESSFPFKFIKMFMALTRNDQLSFRIWCENFTPWTKLPNYTGNNLLLSIKSLLICNNMNEWGNFGKRLGLVYSLYYIEDLCSTTATNSNKIQLSEELKVLIMSWLRDPSILIDPVVDHLPYYISSDWVNVVSKLISKDINIKIEEVRSLIMIRLSKLKGSYRDKLLSWYNSFCPSLSLKDISSERNPPINIQYAVNLPINDIDFTPVFLTKRLSTFLADTDNMLQQCYQNNKQYWEAWAKLFDSEIINPECLIDHEDIYHYPFGEVMGLIQQNKACLFTRRDLNWILINKINPWTKVELKPEHFIQIENHLKLTSSCQDTATLAEIFKKLKTK